MAWIKHFRDGVLIESDWNLKWVAPIKDDETLQSINRIRLEFKAARVRQIQSDKIQY